MLGESGQHVIEEADASLDVRLTGAIEIDGHGDSGLAGLAVDDCCAGHGVNQGATISLCAKRRLWRQELADIAHRCNATTRIIRFPVVPG